MGFKTRPCEDCGEPTTRKRKSHSGWLCGSCSTARAVAAISELRAGHGPAVDRYLAGIDRYLRRRAEAVLDSRP